MDLKRGWGCFALCPFDCRGGGGSRCCSRRNGFIRSGDCPAGSRPIARSAGRHCYRYSDRRCAADRAGNDPVIFADPARRSLGRRVGRQVAEGIIRDRSFRRHKSEPSGQYTSRQGGRKPDHQPDRVRGKQQDRREGSERRRAASCAPASSTPAPVCRTM